MIRQFWNDPKLFNYFILCIYFLTAIRWAMFKRWADVFYWLSAFAITATVTFGYKR